jgi:hypothetical protein
MNEDRKPTRLPPPAFPPGSRRHTPDGAGATEAGRQEADEDRSSGTLEDALLMPDEDGASDMSSFTFISPDEPMPDRDVEQGTATGIGDDPYLDLEDLIGGRDPHVRELVIAVSKLAEALRRRGEAGLHVSPGMSRFEGTLRSYCVGYLSGRRADGEE